VKLRQAQQIISNLGYGRDVDECGSVKLMKLIYLFFIEYCVEVNATDKVPDVFRDYVFLAYQYGPVEKSIYFNLPVVKEWVISCSDPTSWSAFGGVDSGVLDKVATRVRNRYVRMTTDEIVDFTHYHLCEWRKTQPYAQMEFKDGYAYECQAARENY